MITKSNRIEGNKPWVTYQGKQAEKKHGYWTTKYPM